MASLLDIGTETRDAPLRVGTESGLYIIGTDKIEANAICYGCDGKTLSQTPAATQQYVLNRNTKKFHKPTCSSVKQMKEKNRQVYEGTREEIIQRGYAPCKRCKP